MAAKYARRQRASTPEAAERRVFALRASVLAAAYPAYHFRKPLTGLFPGSDSPEIPPGYDVNKEIREAVAAHAQRWATFDATVPQLRAERARIAREYKNVPPASYRTPEWK